MEVSREDFDKIVTKDLNFYAEMCHELSVERGWWTDMATGESTLKTRNRPEMMMLMVSEIAEMMEGYRKGLMDEHLPQRTAEEVELADLLIRVFDYAWAYGFDLEKTVEEKLEYNLRREDHSIEHRQSDKGKKF